MQPVKIGLIGCGNISNAYFNGAAQFPMLDIAACADLNMDAAVAKGKEHNVAKVCTVDDLLADRDIELILNLTIPAAHVEVGLKALGAGKHVYSEKPLGISVDHARKLIDTAESKNLRVGCAPDTFLGTSHQTCRKLIDEGAIGTPVAATAFMLCPGHESWHPNPAFYYQPGGGPMLDMGPYYLTALINMLGPIHRIAGIAGKQITDRTVATGPHAGEKINVQVDDHVAGTVQFQSNAIATLVTSFATRFPTHDGRQPITIYGSEGTLRVPDPNGFDGPIGLRRKTDDDWQTITPEHHHPNGRSLGLADMATALRTGRPHRASGDLALAVLQAMQGFIDSSKTSRHVTVAGPADRPAMLPTDLKNEGQLD